MFNVECLMFNEERRNIMKTNMLRNTVVMIMMAVLPALTGVWQAQAIDYPSYKTGGQRQEAAFQGAVVPASSFQSTSSFTGQISASRQESMLNDDGSVNEEAYMPGSARTLRRDGNPGTPGDDDEEEGEWQPIGDAVWPLLLLALAYVGVRTRRRVVNNKE